MSLNIHIYQTDFQFESRLLRITETISRLNYIEEIHIYATYSEGLEEVELLDDVRKVFRVKTMIKSNSSYIMRYLFLIEWSLRIFLMTRSLNVTVVNPHSVPALPISWIFKLFHKSLICYDTHEIETEQYVGVSITKYISKIIEFIFIRFCDIVFTTSDGYSDWYKKEYKMDNVYTVKNYSRKRNLRELNSTLLRDFCECTNEDLLFVYQGILGTGRGVDLLLEVFKKLPTSYKIVYLGYGERVDEIKKMSELHDNIYYHSAVPSSEVYKYIQSCDVGFCIIEKSHLSYYHTLPNKMLECLNVTVPVIVSNFPDMSASVMEYECGWPVEVDKNNILKLIQDITREDLETKKENAKSWALDNTWESQELVLKKQYDKLLNY